MKELYLLRGLPGAGKTTLANSIGGIRVEADQYFTREGIYKFDANQLSNAHNSCECQTESWMRAPGEQVNSDRIVVSNTFTREKEMTRYFEMAKEHGYRVYSIIVENRHCGVNVHDVPEETLDKMEKRFAIKLR